MSRLNIYENNMKNGSGEEAEETSRFVHIRRSADRLKQLGEYKRYPKNAVLIDMGEIPDCCYLVLSGQVTAVKETGEGNELFFYLMEEDSLCGEVNMLFHRPLPVLFRTSMPSELIRIDEKTLREAIASDPDLAMDVMECVADKFFEAMDELEKIKTHSAAWLLCDLLISFARRYGVSYDEKILINKKLSIDYITNLLGVNRATTVRAIRKLKDMNLLENINGFYCIRGIEQLKRHQEILS